MLTYVAVAVGGAAGAMTRYGLARFIDHRLGGAFPYGTLSVNLLGSLAIGILWALLDKQADVPVELKQLLTVGFLGAFTTFSTFSLDTMQLLQDAAYGKAMVNVLMNVVLCIAAAWLGTQITRWR